MQTPTLRPCDCTSLWTTPALRVMSSSAQNGIEPKTAKIDNDICRPSNTGGCFTKGTLVHTKDGLKPIEEIQAGDYVLSSPENGTGGQDYKRVLKTFRYENKTIWKIHTLGIEPGSFAWVASTGNHPFWVEGKGWTRADEVEKGEFLRKAGSGWAHVFRIRPVYRTEQDGVGWVSELNDARTSYGTLFDYANHTSVPKGDHDDYISQEIYSSDDPYLKVTVYNLEVENHHTYYVGKIGILVRHTNCGND